MPARQYRWWVCSTEKLNVCWRFVWEQEDVKILRHLWKRTLQRHELSGVVMPRRCKHIPAFRF